MTSRFRLMAVAGALALATQPALAADKVSPERTASAVALVQKLEFERVLDKMFVNLKDLFAENAIASIEHNDSRGIYTRLFQSLPGGRSHFAQLLGDEFLAALRKRYPEVMKTAADEYAAAFSAEELKELNGFFSTGAGKKWLEVSPTIEESLGKTGETLGMKAGLEALTNAMKRAEAEQNDKGSE